MSRGFRYSFRSVFICAVIIIAAIVAVMPSQFPPASPRQNFVTRKHALGGLSDLLTRPAALTDTPANQLVANYGKLPLSFEANEGQVRGPVQFFARGQGYTLFLNGGDAILTFQAASQNATRKARAGNVENSREGIGNRVLNAGNSRLATRPSAVASSAHTARPGIDNGARSVYRMKLVGANANAAVTGADELPGKSNYFIGNDPKKWRTNVANYASVKYAEVYPGIDLIYYGNNGGQLEYDFVVAPGANPNVVTLGVVADSSGPVAGEHDSSLQIGGNGDLVIKYDGGEVHFQKPVVYQEQTTVDSSQLAVQHDDHGSKFQTRHSSVVTRHSLE